MKALYKFWEQFPALFYGLALLLSFAFALTHNLFLLIPLTTLFFSNKIPQLLFLLLGSFLYMLLFFKSEQVPKEGCKGVAVFEPTAISSSITAFQTSYLYKGTLHSFSNKNFKNQPCMLYSQELHTGSLYSIPVTLFQKKNGSYFLKGKKWSPIENKSSLASLRFRCKKFLKEHIFSHIFDFHTASFLSGISTGEIQDPLLQFFLARLGLQHLLAISGFHFTLITLLIASVLRPFFSPRLCALLLLFATFLYFLFIGPSPSVVRAFSSTALFLLATLLGKESHALNRLGFALFCTLLMDPHACLTASFQLSFAATFAILLLYPTARTYFEKIWEKRSLQKALQLHTTSKLDFLLFTFFKEALCLNLAVHIVTIPLGLFFFHKFPFYSLLYNLFIPFLVTFSLFLLCFSLFFDLFSLGGPIHALNESYTSYILNLIMNAPKAFAYTFSATPSSSFVLLLLTLLFTLCVFFYRRQKDEILFRYI